MRAGIAAGGLTALFGCGPVIVDLPARADTSSGNGSSVSVTRADEDADDAAASELDTSLDETAFDDTVFDDTAFDGTGFDGTGFDGDGSTLSLVGCSDDGSVTWLAEVHLTDPPPDCVSVPGFGTDDVLSLGLEHWDGNGGMYEVGVDPNAAALHGSDALVGTFTLAVSSPYHPEHVDYDLAREGSSYMGSLGLAGCSFVTDLPCDTGTTGG